MTSPASEPGSMTDPCGGADRGGSGCVCDPPWMTRRCYSCDREPAVYGATLDWDLTPEHLLCLDCAAFEREGGSVVEIHTLKEHHG